MQKTIEVLSMLLVVAGLTAGAARADEDSWSQDGNAGTDPTVNFVGTTDPESLVIRTDDRERMRVTNRGRVGIGTAEPEARLDVRPGAGEDGLVVRHDALGQPDLLVDESGNVCINSNDAPARLVVRNDFFGQRPLMSVVAGTHPAVQVSSEGSVTIDPVGAGVALRVRASSTTPNSIVTPVPFHVTGVADANAIYVSRAAHVGIGTVGEDITDRLRIHGGENDGTRASVRIVSGASQQTMLLDGNEIDGVNAGLFLNHNSAENVVLATGGGNVGVGTSSPDHELVVQGNDPVLQIRDDAGDNSAEAARLELLERAGGTFNAGGYLRWKGDTNRLLIGTKEDGDDTDVVFINRANHSVGIGTEVTGGSRLAVSNPNHQIRIVDSDNNKTWTLTTHQSTGGLGFWEDASDPRFIVRAGGRVGIGTTSPDHELVVQGDDPAFQIRDDTDNDSADAARIELLERAGGTFNGGAFLWWNGETDKLLIGTKEGGDNENVLVIDRATQSVGIGTQTPGNFRLAVNGPVRAKEVVVETGWPDFVFAPGYELRPLEEVKAHVEKHGHLPDVPTAAEVADHGVRLGEMESKLLQKVEELTLYLIDLHERVGELERENQRLRRAGAGR